MTKEVLPHCYASSYIETATKRIDLQTGQLKKDTKLALKQDDKVEVLMFP